MEQVQASYTEQFFRPVSIAITIAVGVCVCLEVWTILSPSHSFHPLGILERGWGRSDHGLITMGEGSWIHFEKVEKDSSEASFRLEKPFEKRAAF